ncbi:EAL domain-containing protein [Actinotalea sp. M2MS4P-6]|uniref:putative bifunctional diguanylate cyclase/phosphodiesterase n=1 Tax=Actinotalea sp. M2MS4P-6 TaxID=2983762 RepID=UPI0021E4E827|nr:EAL domain-containing protein [Actinotalea sp. M2MS4P-6]MCV2395381.1 EAL domain-containing protein [Actinotalea sp. M2MS4P-6]
MGLARAPREPSGADDGDAIVIRARWLGAALTVLQLALYVPTDGVSVPRYSLWWGLVPAGLLVLVNVAELVARRTSTPVPVGTRRVVGLVVDSVAILMLIMCFAFDAASALWTLLLLPVAEASLRRWARASAVTWVVLSLGYVLGLEVSHRVAGTPSLSLDSLTYRIGVLGIVTFLLVGLTRRLNEQIASTAAGEAEVDQLRAVAAAARRMSALDVPTVIREVTAAAEQLGFAEAQVWSRTGRLGEPSEGDDGYDLTGSFDQVATATQDLGWATVETAPADPGQVVVAAGIGAGDAVEALLVGRLATPVDVRVADGLSLLSSHAAAALANALRFEEGRAFEERLAHQAAHDELTGLPSRSELGERARRLLARDRGRDRLVALLYLDLDRFKQINDVLGHSTGDELLRRVADRIGEHIRPDDVCARLGGDEFVVLSGGHAGVMTVLALAYRLRSALHEPFAVGDLTLDVEVSIGIAWAPADGDDVHLLLQHADVAMHAAKRSRAGVTLYRDVQDTDDASQLGLLGDLRRALESGGQLDVYFQPIVALDTDRPASFEALIRWHHPTRGMVQPGTFIPVAESTSIIHQLTDVVLERALAALARWRAHGIDARVAVNLSPRALVDVTLTQRVDAFLRAADVDPGWLCLEITEETLVDDPARAVATMDQLKELGVRLSIDDFGTGYSSMSYLKSLPVDDIKIDRSFVTDMLTSARDGSLVHSVVELAHRLDLEVVAEGVEDGETMSALRATGCDHVQGFHVARPMPEADVLAWAERWAAEHVTAPQER